MLRKKIAWFVFLSLIVFLGIVLVAYLYLLRFHKSSAPVPAGMPENLVAVHVRFNDASSLDGWKEHAFQKHSEYKIGRDEHGESVLRATSRDSNSALFKTVDISPEDRPILSWEWKAVRFPKKPEHKVFVAKPENDFSGRVCAIFGKQNPLTTDIINYVWDEYFPAGTMGTSPFWGRTKIMVVHSGPPSPENPWAFEQRDVVKDYETLYGKPPKNNLKAIAIMTDSDDSHSQTECLFRSLSLNQTVSETGKTKEKHNIVVVLRDGSMGFIRSIFSKVPKLNRPKTEVDE